MNPFDGLGPKLEHMINSVSSNPVYGQITTFTPYIIFAVLLVIAIVFAAKSQLALVPKNRFVGVIEFFVNFASNEVGYGILGESAKKHMPFLLTMFIYILVANLVGIIPGAKAATGAIGTTLTLTVISFIYFTYHGIKHHGGGFRYIKSIKPSGLSGFMGVFVWFLEFISMIMRLLTLSVRLFVNMFAGHLILGVFALMTTAFIAPIFTHFSLTALPLGLVGAVWFALLCALYALEMFVACVQAFVFTLLSSVYIFLATAEH